MARIAFRRVKQEIPTTNSKQAEYWYKYWKVKGADQQKLEKMFENVANEVDGIALLELTAP